jgi:hypothetical protein
LQYLILRALGTRLGNQIAEHVSKCFDFNGRTQLNAQLKNKNLTLVTNIDN